MKHPAGSSMALPTQQTLNVCVTVDIHHTLQVCDGHCIHRSVRKERMTLLVKWIRSNLLDLNYDTCGSVYLICTQDHYYFRARASNIVFI